jgi:hypothetical protein
MSGGARAREGKWRRVSRGGAGEDDPEVVATKTEQVKSSFVRRFRLESARVVSIDGAPTRPVTVVVVVRET